MSKNTIGKIFCLTTFGESHGTSIGGIIDGCPAGLTLDNRFIQSQLARRRPGQSAISTPRQENDKIIWLSGFFERKTTGTPIAFLIENQNAKPKDYEAYRNIFRPSHADYTYFAKYGIRDHRGGGRASARETAARVVGGAVAQCVLNQHNIKPIAWVSQIGSIEFKNSKIDYNEIEKNVVRCPDSKKANEMITLISQLAKKGETIGGVVSCSISGVPVGLGEPVFDKLHASLAHAMMGINAVRGFEIGKGFASAQMTGSQHNDLFETKGIDIQTITNNSGGIQGGISNGNEIIFRVAFKPIPTLLKPQKTVDINGNNCETPATGRHDVCAVPRAVPIIESMASLVILDFLLRNKTAKTTDL